MVCLLSSLIFRPISAKGFPRSGRRRCERFSFAFLNRGRPINTARCVHAEFRFEQIG